MSALHRAHRGAWASRRDLGFCSGVTIRSLSIQALKPFPELGPHLRHRNPQRSHPLISRCVSTCPAVHSLLPTLAWSGKAVHD
jgi:hypothetical protein